MGGRTPNSGAESTLRRDAATRSGKTSWLVLAVCLMLALAAAGLWWAQYSLRVAPTGPYDMQTLAAPLDAFSDDPPVRGASDWLERRAPLLRNAFQTQVYGAMPAARSPVRGEARLIDAEAFGGAGRLEELTVEIAGSSGPVIVNVLLATPTSLAGQAAPVIIAPNFCGNRASLGGRYRTVSTPLWTAPRCRSVLGRQTTVMLNGDSIIRTPYRDLLRAGYAVASFSPAEIVPDDARLAPVAIARLPAPEVEGPLVGAIGAWAWSISRVVDVVETDARLDPSRIALFGHSRFGKAALVAAALDTRIGAVIANQSGRLGAAPSADHMSASQMGEPLAALFSRFPHWFPTEARDAPEVQGGLDQQLLLALIAPRPLLLGGARLDKWSDPMGAFQSALAASAAYELLGAVGLDQPTMKATNLDADVAYYFRSGGHGVRRSDWRTAVAFLDRRLAAADRGGAVLDGSGLKGADAAPDVR